MNIRLILLPFLCGISSVYADAWDDLSQAAQVAYTANLNGEYVRQSKQGTDSFDIYRLRSDSDFTERRVAKQGRAFEIIRNREKIVYYAANADDLKYANTDESNRFPAVLPYHAYRLRESYTASYQGEGRVTGRDCHIVRLTPLDDNRYTQEFCLDNTDNLPLSRVYLWNNAALRADLFAALDRESLPQAEELTSSRGLNYTFTRQRDEDFSRLGENDLFIQNLPAGFRVAGYEQNTQGGFYLITDGLVHITLFVEFANKPQNHPNKNGIISVAVVNGKKYRYTAIGDLPPDGLARWLNSVEFAE
ncbi:MAG: hypothetical protein J6W29_08560 [Neisseriaceae bacterium]|nr:hypothetical protein [Neisseriaceae bacterium]